MNPLQKRIPFILSLLLLANLSIAQNTPNKPHLGYAYPAGAQRGTSIEITLGGRYLKTAKNALISGEGVTVEVLDHFNTYQRRYKSFLRDVRKSEVQANKDPSYKEATPRERKDQFRQRVEAIKTVIQGNKEFEVPDHPYFTRIAQLSPEEFQTIYRKHAKMEGVQTNNEISELVTLKLTITPDATLGDRELRLRSFNGYSNAITFQIGGYSETCEKEPNDERPKGAALPAPFILNGQILPGDTDSIRFSATKGQNLVLNLHARQLIPYLADAVPGWFQAVLSLHDSKGKEIDYVDDYLFHPDPVILFEVPADGIYEARIRDAIFRGREDFVYRLSVAESPFVTAYHPMGGKPGDAIETTLEGWNLPNKSLNLKTNPSTASSHSSRISTENALSNKIHYETTEGLNLIETAKQNDSFDTAQAINSACTVSGRIERPGDLDIFRFKGSAGQALAAETRARRLNSPLDSKLELFDDQGIRLAWNDDLESPLNPGTLTHHADSRLEATLPHDGNYFIQISDTQNQGGSNYGYRLQIGDPEPDFKVWVSPAIVQLGAGQTMPLTATVQRVNGFSGPIHLQTARDGFQFSLSGATVPEGQNEIEFTITAPALARGPVRQLQLLAIGEGELEDIHHRAIPCDRQTQAFITPHLVESQSLRVEVMRRPKAGVYFQAQSLGKHTVQPNSTLNVQFKKQKIDTPRTNRTVVEEFEYSLRSTEPGLSLKANDDQEEHVDLTFHFDSTLPVSQKGTLIVDVFAKMKKRKNQKNSSRLYLGTLPAIPYQIEAAQAL